MRWRWQRQRRVPGHKIRPLSIIVAVDEYGGFGKDGKIPWNIPEDLKHFQKVTKGGVCIMGRATYQDMYDMVMARKKKPTKVKKIIPGRECFVVSNTVTEVEGATVVTDIMQIFNTLPKDDDREIFIIGGERMFIEALPFTNKVYMTIITGTYDCDKYFPLKSLKKFEIVDGKKSEAMCTVVYNRIRE